MEPKLRATLSRIAIIACVALIVLAVSRVIGNEGISGAARVTSASTKADRQLPVYCVDRDDKAVSLTFDAAWGAEHTREILDILDEKQVKATFFLVGFWVDAYPDMVKEIADRGHTVGNHSTKHPHMTELSPAQVALELSTTSDKIEALIGKRPAVFRPPFGDYNNTVIKTSRELGMEPIQWDVDSLDWKDKGVQPLIDQVMGKVQGGSIVLFHNNSTYIVKALPTIIDRLREKGYRMVPVPELLLDGDTTIDHEGRQRAR